MSVPRDLIETFFARPNMGHSGSRQRDISVLRRTTSEAVQSGGHDGRRRLLLGPCTTALLTRANCEPWSRDGGNSTSPLARPDRLRPQPHRIAGRPRSTAPPSHAGLPAGDLHGGVRLRRRGDRLRLLSGLEGLAAGPHRSPPLRVMRSGAQAARLSATVIAARGFGRALAAASYPTAHRTPDNRRHRRCARPQEVPTVGKGSQEG